MTVNLRSLIGKLNSTTRNAVEGAAGLCLSRTHYDVEVEHVLTKLLSATGADFHFILRHFGVDPSRFAGRTGAQPRQAEVRQRPHSCYQPYRA